MSTEISLIGIGKAENGETEVICVRARYYELGFSGLRDLLRGFEDGDILIKAKESEQEAGIDQFLIADPDSFVTHVRENPGYWDSYAMGWDPAIAGLEKDLAEGHQLTWWFVLEY